MIPNTDVNAPECLNEIFFLRNMLMSIFAYLFVYAKVFDQVIVNTLNVSHILNSKTMNC